MGTPHSVSPLLAQCQQIIVLVLQVLHMVHHSVRLVSLLARVVQLDQSEVQSADYLILIINLIEQIVVLHLELLHML